MTIPTFNKLTLPQSASNSPTVGTMVATSSSSVDDIEETYRQGKLIARIIRNKNGQRHCLTGPAIEKFYYPSLACLSRCFFINNKKHNAKGPAVTYYYESGQISNEEYWLNNKLHRINGAASLTFYEDGSIVRAKWFYHGNMFNVASPDKPSYLEFYAGGQLSLEHYTEKYGNLYRDFRVGPALIKYHKNGRKLVEKYICNGEYHNLLGPAIIEYDENGQIVNEVYKINNKLYTDYKTWKPIAEVEYKALLLRENNEKVEVTGDCCDLSLAGCYCRKCGSFEKYTAPDGKDGKITCWGCKNW